MSSSPPPARPSYLPAPELQQRELPATPQPRRAWFRVHRSGASPLEFALRAHHRFSHPECPFPVLYLGASAPTCLWEYFGDDVFGGRHVISAAKWAGCSLSEVIVPAVRVCALTLESTRAALAVDRASLLAAALATPQAWGLALQQHPAAFQGLKYSSRFLDRPCLALFDRDGLAGRLQARPLGPLSELAAAADWLEERQAALV